MQEFLALVRWLGEAPVGQLVVLYFGGTHVLRLNMPNGTFSLYQLVSSTEALANYQRDDYTGPVLKDWPTTPEGWLAVVFLPYGANSRFVGWLPWEGSIDEFFASIKS